MLRIPKVSKGELVFTLLPPRSLQFDDVGDLQNSRPNRWCNRRHCSAGLAGKRSRGIFSSTGALVGFNIDFTPHSPPCCPTSFRPRSGIMETPSADNYPFREFTSPRRHCYLRNRIIWFHIALNNTQPVQIASFLKTAHWNKLQRPLLLFRPIPWVPAELTKITIKPAPSSRHRAPLSHPHAQVWDGWTTWLWN